MTTTTSPSGTAETRTAFAVLVALSVCHLLNDTIQSLLPALYPVLQQNYALSFTQIGMLHFVFQVTASLLQPAVGLYTDRRPMFRLSTAGMGASLLGSTFSKTPPVIPPRPIRQASVPTTYWTFPRTTISPSTPPIP
jgi:FSR family fosmidomycin resistance protein-like MFS transporter